MAWKALTEKYSGHTKEARREYHEKLVDTKMEPGQDSEDLFFVLDQYRDLLEEMGQTVHDERYERGHHSPSHFYRVRKRTNRQLREAGLRLDDLRRMVHTMYRDNLSKSFNAKPVAGHGIAK